MAQYNNICFEGLELFHVTSSLHLIYIYAYYNYADLVVDINLYYEITLNNYFYYLCRR